MEPPPPVSSKENELDQPKKKQKTQKKLVRHSKTCS